jgi:hypothetical protein
LDKLTRAVAAEAVKKRKIPMISHIEEDAMKPRMDMTVEDMTQEEMRMERSTRNLEETCVMAEAIVNRKLVEELNVQGTMMTI